MLLWELSRAVQKQMSARLNEIKRFCKEEWAKLPPQCETTKLLRVIAACSFFSLVSFLFTKNDTVETDVFL